MAVKNNEQTQNWSNGMCCTQKNTCKI